MRFMHDPGNRHVFQPSVFVESFHVSHIPTSAGPLLSLIHHFSSIMSTASDAMCWHPRINAKVNEETKGVEWFAQGCGPLVARQSDTLGLHRKEIGSRGNESGPSDVRITIHRWREVGYHSLQGVMNTAELLCNMTTGCRSHTNSSRVLYVGGDN